MRICLKNLGYAIVLAALPVSFCPAAVAVPPSPSPAPAVDPCALIAQGDAGPAMHGEARSVISRKIATGKFCQYHSSDGKMNIFVQNVNAKIMKALPGMGATAEPNIGDEAYLFRNSVYIRKGKSAIQVSLYSSSLLVGTPTADLLALAKLAASRM